jgi:multicomponent Na+:H+ antiporter subunit G
MIETLASFAAAAGAQSAANQAATVIDWDAALSWSVHILSWAAIVSGSFFVLVGSIGLIRMPDMFTRMHAASIIDSIGAGLLIVGMMLQAGPTLITLKLLFIFILFFITSPVATHALAQAALHAGDKPQLKNDRTGTKAGS